ncbi:hypothetical protein PHYC_01027 [Phycisphaerales bacterium]|nr:hypothetical protein PHYC_01027 [Phycisphaerales bacterium]
MERVRIHLDSFADADKAGDTGTAFKEYEAALADQRTAGSWLTVELEQRLTEGRARYDALKIEVDRRAQADAARREQIKAEESRRVAEAEQTRVEAARRADEIRRDPAESFRNFARCVETALVKLSLERYEKLDKEDKESFRGWDRLALESFDVKKTDSLISPVVGELGCKFHSYWYGEYQVDLRCLPGDRGWVIESLSVRWTGEKGRLDPDNKVILREAEKFIKDSQAGSCG